jgi:NADH-quinone oxidoreductase subunit N
VIVSFNAAVLAGVLAPLLGALLVLALDVLWPRQREIHYVIGFVALAVGLWGPLPALGGGRGDTSSTLCLPGQLSDCFYSVNAASALLQVVALAAAAVVLLLMWPADARQPAERTSVSVALILAASGGAVAVAGARDLGSWIVALEIATIPVIVLVALPGTKAAINGAMQLLTTSLISVGLLAIGAACWYGATGSPFLSVGAALQAPSGAHRSLLTLSVVLLLAGLGFKLSLAPFHAWTPTAYVGAPLPVAAFLSGVSKVAALAALVVVFQALASLGSAGVVAVAVLALLSMTLGNLVALRQDNVVRLLAWSTIAQAGWVALPLVSPSSSATRAAIVYLSAYVIATVLAFAVVIAVADRYGVVRSGAAAAVGVGTAGAAGGPLAVGSGFADLSGGAASGRYLSSYSGLLRRSALLGGSLALALTSLAGIPPGLLGLVAKVGALRPVLAEGWWLLALGVAVNVVLGVAVYFRWFKVLLADEAPAGAPAVPERAHPSVTLAIVIGSVVLLLLSVLPDLLGGRLG